MKYKCACCGEYTLTKPSGYYDSCSKCSWVDDTLQNELIDYRGGANTISLREAQEIYKKSILENLDPAREIFKANKYAHEHWNQEEEEERGKRLGYWIDDEDDDEDDD